MLEQTIRVLDELNDLERLVSICGEKITGERHGNVQDVRSLFKELESNDWLGIDCLDTLKEILTQTEKSDLLKEVEEFEKRRSRENKFKKRKGNSTCLRPIFLAVLSPRIDYNIILCGLIFFFLYFSTNSFFCVISWRETVWR